MELQPRDVGNSIRRSADCRIPGTLSAVKWTWVLALAAVAGGVIFAAYRRNQKELADAALWAEATDSLSDTK